MILLWSIFYTCLTGPGPLNTPGMRSHCLAFDFDHDFDVDLIDIAAFQRDPCFCPEKRTAPDVLPFLRCRNGPGVLWRFLMITCDRLEAVPLYGGVCWYERSCAKEDRDADGDVDLVDYAMWERNLR